MGIFKFLHEVKIKVAHHRMFKALATKLPELLPKVDSSIYKSVEILEGDGGVGTIYKTTFSEGAPFKYATYKINVVDPVNHVTKYTLIEGGELGDKFESIVYEVKFEHSHDGGCLVKQTIEYHTKGDFQLKEEDTKAGKEQVEGFFKSCEGYLIANPHAYA